MKSRHCLFSFNMLCIDYYILHKLMAASSLFLNQFVSTPKSSQTPLDLTEAVFFFG